MNGIRLKAKQRACLERQLEYTENVRDYRRKLAILQHDAGIPIVRIAEAMGVGRCSEHRWIAAYWKTSSPFCLLEKPWNGRPRLWTDADFQWLETVLETSPEDFGYYAVNWTVPLLCEHLAFSIRPEVSDDTMRRSLDTLGYVWKRPRYVLAPDPERDKKDKFDVKSEVCRVVASSWPKMKLTCSCFLRRVPHGANEERLRKSCCQDGTLAWPCAKRLLVLCIGGGSKSATQYLFKEDLQRLANQLGIEIRMAHYPPYCSKHNPIEHHVFPHITRACADLIFHSVDIAKQFMERASTSTGLKAKVRELKKIYVTGRSYTAEFKSTMKIVFDEYLGKWNFTAIPQTS